MADFEKAGSCPTCGAPIYVSKSWNDPNTPPPARYSCACPRPSVSGALEDRPNNNAKVLVE